MTRGAEGYGPRYSVQTPARSRDIARSLDLACRLSLADAPQYPAMDSPMPMSVYQARQRHQWNYGLFAVGELAVVRSLVEESLDEWRDERTVPPFCGCMPWPPPRT